MRPARHPAILRTEFRCLQRIDHRRRRGRSCFAVASELACKVVCIRRRTRTIGSHQQLPGKVVTLTNDWCVCAITLDASMNRILSSPVVQKNYAGTAHCPRRLRHRSAGPHQRTVQSRLEQAFRRTSSEPEAEGGSASFPSSWPTRQTHSSIYARSAASRRTSHEKRLRRPPPFTLTRVASIARTRS